MNSTAPMVIHVYLILIPILLLVSALVSAGETSLLALSRTQIEGLKEKSPLIHRRISGLVASPETLLSTVVVGNEFLNVMIGTFVAALLEQQFRMWDRRLLVVTSVIVSVALTLTFSDILPKIVAFKRPLPVASVLVYPLSWLEFLLTPIRRVFVWVSQTSLALVGVKPAPTRSLSESDLLTLVEAGADSGALDAREKQLIYNVFEFSDRTVASVMTPWDKIFCLPESLPLDEILTQVRKRGYSRIPILNRGAEVVGVLYAKELLKLWLVPEKDREQTLRQAVFPPHFVSVHKKVASLFREFRVKKVHFALVVDEFGANLGIVTLEDLLNALFLIQRRRETSS